MSFIQEMEEVILRTLFSVQIQRKLLKFKLYDGLHARPDGSTWCVAGLGSHIHHSSSCFLSSSHDTLLEKAMRKSDFFIILLLV
jgi:hypothetical protein